MGISESQPAEHQLQGPRGGGAVSRVGSHGARADRGVQHKAATSAATWGGGDSRVASPSMRSYLLAQH
jgi:hypothetical protein